MLFLKAKSFFFLMVANLPVMTTKWRLYIPQLFVYNYIDGYTAVMRQLTSRWIGFDGVMLVFILISFVIQTKSLPHMSWKWWAQFRRWGRVNYSVMQHPSGVIMFILPVISPGWCCLFLWPHTQHQQSSSKTCPSCACVCVCPWGKETGYIRGWRRWVPKCRRETTWIIHTV